MKRLLALLIPASFFLQTPGFSMARMPWKTPEAEIVKKEPLTLRDCYLFALRKSEALAIKKEDIEKTEADFLHAIDDAVGDVHFVITDEFREPQNQTGGGDGGDSVGGSFTREEVRERKFVITQPIFQGFKALGAAAGAGSLREQKTQEWIRAKQLLFLDVSAAFYGVLEKKKDLLTYEETQKLYKERITELEERERIGRSRRSEVVTALSRMKILEADRATAKAEIEISRLMLEFLTGTLVSPDQILEEKVPDQKVPREVAGYLEDLQYRPDLEASENAMDVAKKGVIVAQSGLWPNINLESNVYEHRDTFQSGINWDVLFKIDIPIFQGGKALSEVKRAWTGYKQAQYSFSGLRRDAEREIKETFTVWMLSKERHQALSEAVEAARENYVLQREEYSRNLVSNLDVLVALESLLNTRRDANRAFYVNVLNFWKLQIASGGIPYEGEIN